MFYGVATVYLWSSAPRVHTTIITITTECADTVIILIIIIKVKMYVRMQK